MKIPIRTHWVILIVLITWIFPSCSENEDETPSWHPLDLNDGWDVSTVEGQGLDPAIIDDLYADAGKFDNLFSFLIVKNGYLVAEQYFNGRSVSDAEPVASVTKSIVSALTGIALQENYIVSINQKLKDFFPDIDWGSTDPKKSEITIEHVLQMRSGYPWEEVYGLIDTLRASTNWIHYLKDFQLVNDPGTKFGYSNFTAHMMGIIISRSADESLISFARNHLFNDMGVSVPYWPADASGYNYGSGDIFLTPRSLAKFGQMYLDNGFWNNVQLIPSEWIDASLQIYSPTTYGREILTNINKLGYGYLWWSGISGDHPVWFAWGHGGQLVVIIHDLNMVVVTTASIPPGFGDSAWQKTKVIMELAGQFISKL
jgi:CubicO group peptidase (beta-lactamase class C family)